MKPLYFALLALAGPLLAPRRASADITPPTAQPDAPIDAPRPVSPINPPPPKPAVFGLTALRVMREKGILSDAEYEGAIRDISDTNGARAGEATTVVLGKFATTIYGFAEIDGVHDSTESFNEVAGNNQVARGGTYAGDHDRSQLSIRNSRIGIRSQAPDYHGIRASALFEMDFFGTVAPVGQASTTAPYYGSENAFFTNPSIRARHLLLKVETPYVDVLFGQYWSLFGWQSLYFPSSVQIQGLPGELYSRNVQLRLSKTVKLGSTATIEVAIAALRPPQRDSGVPEGQAGLRFAVERWRGVHTRGATSTEVAPLSVALTGDARSVRLPELSAAPKTARNKFGSALALDGFVPVIPATRDSMSNSLSLTGEVTGGYGDSDQFTGLGGVGTAYPTLPDPTNAPPAPVYAPDIDPGIAQVDAAGKVHMIEWTTWLVGAQYYLPRLSGRVWVSANYSHSTSSNVQHFGPAARVRSDLDFWDVNLFGDVTTAVRIGAEIASTRDRYQDHFHALNERVQLSGFYIF